MKKMKTLVCLSIVTCCTVLFSFLHFNKVMKLKIPKEKISMPIYKDWVSHVFDNSIKIGNQELNFNNSNQIHSNVHMRKYEESVLITIAIGVALTSQGIQNITRDNLRYKFPFFRTLLPSFCKTSTQDYSYHFYVAFDFDDHFFSKKEYLLWFTDTFLVFQKTTCQYVSELQLHMIQCDHNHKPSWAQNDAMMQAFLDDRDFYYRVNDDTLMKSSGWTEAFIRTLKSLKPPLVGVVGPKQSSGNTNILTYDFVHRTHMEIFGVYYPRLFTDWFADNWITGVYSPNRTVKLSEIKVIHTQSLGTRYTSQFGIVAYLQEQIKQDINTLKRYLNRMNSMEKMDTEGYRGKRKVFSFTLTSDENDDIFGIIRNINLAKIYFPDWYIYVFTFKNVLKPQERTFKKINSTGAVIKFLNSSMFQCVPHDLLNLLIQDEKEVDLYILRGVLMRLGARDSASINYWLEHNGRSVYCVRDHPNHTTHHLNSNLWGSARSNLKNLLHHQSIKRMLIEYFQVENSCNWTRNNFLDEVLWPKVIGNIFCHDSVSCNDWRSSFPFPVIREHFDFIGKKYDRFGIPFNFHNQSERSLNILDATLIC